MSVFPATQNQYNMKSLCWPCLRKVPRRKEKKNYGVAILPMGPMCIEEFLKGIYERIDIHCVLGHKVFMQHVQV